ALRLTVGQAAPPVHRGARTGVDRPAKTGQARCLSYESAWKRRLLLHLGQAGLTGTPATWRRSRRRNHVLRGCSRPPTATSPCSGSASRNQPALVLPTRQCARAAQRRPAPKEPARPSLPDRPPFTLREPGTQGPR